LNRKQQLGYSGGRAALLGSFRNSSITSIAGCIGSGAPTWLFDGVADFAGVAPSVLAGDWPEVPWDSGDDGAPPGLELGDGIGRSTGKSLSASSRSGVIHIGAPGLR